MVGTGVSVSAVWRFSCVWDPESSLVLGCGFAQRALFLTYGGGDYSVGKGTVWRECGSDSRMGVGDFSCHCSDALATVGNLSVSLGDELCVSEDSKAQSLLALGGVGILWLHLEPGRAAQSCAVGPSASRCGGSGMDAAPLGWSRNHGSCVCVGDRSLDDPEFCEPSPSYPGTQ